MNVLVTGVTGRVGRNLARSLIADGHRVRGIVLPDDPNLASAQEMGVDCVVGNLRDYATAVEALDGVDHVAHLGAMMLWGSDEHNLTLFEDNVRGTFNLANAAALSGQIERFVFASSDEVYPSLGSLYQPIDEAHPRLSKSMYGLSKVLGEDILLGFQRTHGLPISIARFALVIEPWESAAKEGWLGRFLFLEPMLGMIEARAGSDTARELSGQLESPDTLLIARDADGTPYLFQCVDVRDLVEGLRLLLSAPAAVGEAFNLSGPSAFEFDQVIPYIAERTGYPVVDARITGEPIRVHHSTAKARAMLGYAPQFDIFRSIDDGLTERVKS